MSEPNIVRIEASCANCRNKESINEESYCKKKKKYLASAFWTPVCVDFVPTKEIMENAIKEATDD